MENFDLSRFTEAHRRMFQTALDEIRGGRKRSHWMWYIFPQMRGLGVTAMSQRYAIQSLDEAVAFLNDPYLGGNLRTISEALLLLPTNDPHAVMGYPDDLKLRSCMTLFGLAAGENSVFQKVLDKFYGGVPDDRTLRLLGL